MKHGFLIAALLVTNMVHAADSLKQLPAKWAVERGQTLGKSTCQTGIDPKLLQLEQRNLSITCRSPEFTALRQSVVASPVWGKKVRFSGLIKVEGVDPEDLNGTGGADLFVESQGLGRPVAEPSNDRRPLAGTTSWEYREVVLDVAPGSASLTYGLRLRGRGQVWVRDLKFEEISPDGGVIVLMRPADLLPAPALGPLPQGWVLMGFGPTALPGKCEVGADTEAPAALQPYLSVHCMNEDIPSFGIAIKTFDSQRYNGKRVRVSVWLKVTDVEGVTSTRYQSVPGGAGLWMGVRAPSTGYLQDRMFTRSTKGSTDWEFREVIVDIPSDGKALMVGFWLQGKGQAWFRDFQVEKVSKKVPVNYKWEDEAASGVTLK